MYNQPYRSTDGWRDRLQELIDNLDKQSSDRMVETLSAEIKKATHDRQWWIARRMEFAIICLRVGNIKEAAECLASSYNSHMQPGELK